MSAQAEGTRIRIAPLARAPCVRRRLEAGARWLALLALLVATVGGNAPSAVAADDLTRVEQAFIARIAAARAAHGLPAYAVGGTLTQVARDQARRMAHQNRLFHNPELTEVVPNWLWVGENVGFGPDAATVHRAFMQSPPHRANILDRRFTRVGVGAVVRDGRVWVSEVFKRPRTPRARQGSNLRPTA